jgi:glycosyltransferase involved in cell wall biosynthesis
LYLGRINKDKGIADLINAFKKIEKHYNVLLIFVGSIEDKNFKHLINNEKNILYFDYSDKPEDWFSLADMLCLPSYREGFGTVVIEAASCSLPSLCSKIYGLKDTIIDGRTGFFHKPGIVNSIKNKMIFAIKNKRLVKNSGKLARTRSAKRF